jgi:hypothetical protein
VRRPTNGGVLRWIDVMWCSSGAGVVIRGRGDGWRRVSAAVRAWARELVLRLLGSDGAVGMERVRRGGFASRQAAKAARDDLLARSVEMRPPRPGPSAGGCTGG